MIRDYMIKDTTAGVLPYRTVLADPPWDFNDKLDKTRRKPYPTLTLVEIEDLKVEDLVGKQAHLYLWCPGTLLDEGIQVVKDWGFDYKQIIPWLKRTKNGKIHFGMGHYYRNCFEFLLFGTRGNMKLKTNNTRNFIDAVKPDRHHSAKPDEAYEVIEKNSEPPYIELFATSVRKGWSAWGWEIDHMDIRQHFLLFDKEYQFR